MQKNRIDVAGYLAGKPELRFLPSGAKVANARLGETYRFMSNDGSVQLHTNWHSLVFYDRLADLALTFEQGENVYIEGSMQQREFTPADGSTRTVHEIHVRSCHLIAAARSERDLSLSNDHQAGILEGGREDDADWPVGPA
jgi:single-strand DNA-binding protein